MDHEQSKTSNTTPAQSQADLAVQAGAVKARSNKGLIIALVVVTLLAATSIAVAVFLSTKIAPPLVDQDSSSSAASGDLQGGLKAREVCAIHEKLCVDVPGGWKADIEEGTYPDKDSEMAAGMTESELVSTDKVVLTSPDGGLRVVLVTGITGVGGRCDTDSAGKTFITQAKKTSLTGYRDESMRSLDQVHAVSIVTTADGASEFTPAIILTSSERLIDRVQGHYCDSVFTDLINNKNIVMFESGGHTNHGALSLSTRSNYMGSLSFEPQTFGSLDEAKQALDSRNYREAFEIIASAHY